MAIDNAKMYMVGREVVQHLFVGILERVDREVRAYNTQLSSDSVAAVVHLKTALDMPHRMRVRITAFNDTYSGGSATLMAQCLALVYGSNITVPDLNTQLTTYEDWAQIRVNASPENNNTMSWQDIADDLTTAFANQYKYWILPFPVGSTDVWGDSY